MLQPTRTVARREQEPSPGIDLFFSVLNASECSVVSRSVAGVHMGTPVVPTVALTEGDHLANMYR
jgi:hypothetical protein